MILIAKEENHFVLAGDMKDLSIGPAFSLKANTLNENCGIRELPNGVVLAGPANCILDYLEYCPDLENLTELTYSLVEDKVVPYLSEKLEQVHYSVDDDKYSVQGILYKDKCFLILRDYLVWEVKDTYALSSSEGIRAFGNGALELYKNLEPSKRVIGGIKLYRSHYGYPLSPVFYKNTSRKGLKVIK